MTRAPNNLLAVRSLLLGHLNDQPGDDLDPAEVGIVGDPDHWGGYHCGSDRVTSQDYSVAESSRDREGLTLDAAALDVGLFTVQADGRTHNLRTFSTWLVAQCVAGTPDTRDIREIIYSPDGEVVKRWDRLKRRATGDDSHLWHTHISFHRDAIKTGRDLTPVFRRYLTTIGLLEDEVTAQETWDYPIQNTVTDKPAPARAYLPSINSMVYNERQAASARHADLMSRLDTLQAALTVLSGKDFTDEAQVASLVLAGLSPEAIAAALPEGLAAQVADELARRLVG